MPVNSTIPPALVSGGLDIGGATPPLVLQANDGGLDLVVLAGGGINVPTIHSAGVVARTGIEIKTPQDFVDKKVATPGLGATLHILFRRWLMEHGVDYKKVRFVEVPIPQTSEALKSGIVDAAVVPEPFLTRIVDAKTGYLVSDYVNELGPGIASVFYASTRTWANANRATVKAFQDALFEAQEFARTNPAGTRAAIGAYLKLPPEVLANFLLPTLQPKVTEQQVAYFAQTLFDQDMIKTKPDPAKIIFQP
jgi:NitT/TauT family transport system substrate-binding protein